MSNDVNALLRPLPFNEGDRKAAKKIRQSAQRVKEAPSKRVVINNADANMNQGFASNEVITSKYTWWNFLFIFLYENLNPLNKFANFYFVCVAICECIPAISITNGRPESLSSLAFVLLVEAITSIKDDVNRHIADRKTNSRCIQVLNKETKQFESIPQSRVRVGDIVQVFEGEIFPADLIFLRSGDPKAPKTCWINTKSLDGETDNKYRQAMKCTSEIEGTAEALSGIEAVVNCELPNNMTNDFNGRMVYRGNTGEITENISIKNVLLRGCILKNTKSVFGAVISTGVDTKVEFGTERKKWWQVGKGSTKIATLTQRTNQVLYCLVVALVILCVLGSLGENIVSHWIIEKSWYISINTDAFMNFWLSFFRFFLLCYQFIPVSLYVSMSMVYAIQSMFMENDIKMYDEVNDEPMRVRTSVLNDDLGQVGYIFSDKTGTLTANLMQFRKCLVDGVSYGLGESDIGRSVKGKQGIEVKVEQTKPVIRKGIYRYCKFEDGSESHPGHTFKEDLRKDDEHAEKLTNFLINMAINHTVILEEKEDGTIELNASSPDEQAFVAGSYCLGVQFLGMDYETNIIELNVLGKMVDIRVLHIIPYESSRKRMSMIAQLPDGSIYLFSKGADSIMFELHDPSLNSSRFVENIACQVSTWAEEAFRTMVFGYKPLTNEEFTQWMAEYEKVCEDPTQKELRKQKKPNRIDQLQFQMENGLILQGASAIEDGLQEGVPETLAQLSDAGIHVWMITGDKVGTAKNIAVACNLLKPNEMKLIEFTKEAVDNSLLDKGGRVEELTDRISPSIIQEIEWQMLEAEKEGDIEKANRILGEFESKHPGLLATRMHCEALAANILNNDPETQSHTYALVVDELFIDFLALSCRQAFLVVAQSCKAVIACRARKDQKAKLTRLVREGNKEVVTLGIGDGANDVEMIRAAHIGVGIIGKEGTQAVNNADYAISQFRFLARLILVYGHRSYRGITLASLLIFYKNIVFTLIQFLYTLLCGFSGTRNQSYVAIFWYNTLLTAFGPVILSIFDKDLRDSNCMRFPQLHRQGIDHRLFSVKRFLLYFLKAIYESVIIAWFLKWSFDDQDFAMGTIDVWVYGLMTVTVNIFIVNLSASAEQSIMCWVSVLAFWLSLLIWIILMFTNSRSLSLYPDYYYSLDLLVRSPTFYLYFILTTVVALLPTMIIKACQREWKPTLSQFIQDVQVRDLAPEVMEEALVNMEKKRSLELELKTMKNKPQDVKMPELMQVTPEIVKSMEMELEISRSVTTPIEPHSPIPKEELKTPYQLMKTGNAQRSIRSIAGLRALTISDQLHGPSYDSQSINSDAQSVLINQINSHDWRETTRPDMFNNIMKQINNVSPIAIIKNISNTIKNSDYVKSITKDSKSGLGTVKEEEEEIEKKEVNVVIMDNLMECDDEEISLSDIPDHIEADEQSQEIIQAYPDEALRDSLTKEEGL